MGVKLTGKQLKAFIASDWGHPDAFWDDVGYVVNGTEIDPLDGFEDSAAADDDVIEITAGMVTVGTKEIDAVKFVRKWLKEQTHVVVAIEVPRAKESAFREHVKKFEMS